MFVAEQLRQHIADDRALAGLDFRVNGHAGFDKPLWSSDMRHSRLGTERVILQFRGFGKLEFYS
jgi:hypothetical protein